MKTPIGFFLVIAAFSAFGVLSCSKAINGSMPARDPELLGVYSEFHNTDKANAVIFIYGGSVAIVTNVSNQMSEGYEGLQVTANLGWMRFDMRSPTPADRSKFSSGYLNFSIKTTNINLYRIGIKSADGAEAWVPLTAAQYHTDGKWYAVSLPISSFGGIDLTQVTNYFMITNSNVIQAGDVLFLDDIYWSDIPVQSKLWTLYWSDEFNTIDTASTWTYETGAGGWGNNELQNYTTTNATISNGILVIAARYSGGTYTSARMKTQGKQSWQYGRIAAKIRMDLNAQGAWPAFWMLGNNGSWPACGEIDIMECGALGSFSTIGGHLNWGADFAHHQFDGTTTAPASGTFASAFHIFEVEWDDTTIIFRLDGVPYFTISTTDFSMGTSFNQPFYTLLNLAVGGPGSGYTGNHPADSASFPNYMFVDWVRVYKQQL